MINTNPMLLIDFYKADHAEMLPEKITKSVSYFTPRMSRVNRWDSVVMFGLQGFIKTYLIDYFNEWFFNRPFAEVIGEYKRIMDASLGENAYKIEKIEKLHKLGYPPIEIVALPDYGITTAEAIGDILKMKDESMHILLTGRTLPDSLRKYADSITTLTTEIV